VKYNGGHFCYYKAIRINLVDENTNFYKSYTDCKSDKDKFYGFELLQLKKSLQTYFKKNNYE
jgi:hypothetical protein